MTHVITYDTSDPQQIAAAEILFKRFLDEGYIIKSLSAMGNQAICQVRLPKGSKARELVPSHSRGQSKMEARGKPVAVTQTISLEPAVIESFMRQVREVVRSAVAEEVRKQVQIIGHDMPLGKRGEIGQAPGDSKLASLQRQADRGGLIDQVTVAELLGVNRRTLRRMIIKRLAPEGRALSKTMIRWRADEIRDWIDAGCPAQEKWKRMRDHRYEDWATARPR
jgi:predicted DNA-binding transcriptional regulator AlpA